jgi:hypothetical protein
LTTLLPLLRFGQKNMFREYDDPAKFVLDGVHFSYRGDNYKGQGFVSWDPKTGFHIDALLDKTFVPVDSFKTLGQIIVNTKEDTFTIWLDVRGHGRAVARAFPLSQKKSLMPDNHLSMNLERVIFIHRWPHELHTPTEFWTGSVLYLTAKKLEFPDPLNTNSTLGGQLFESVSASGLFVEENDNWSLQGRSVSDDKFELSWALNKNRWRKNDAWRFGEAARRALSIVSAQMIWIAKQKLSRDLQRVEDIRERNDPQKLNYYFWPLLGDDMGPIENLKFTKDAFLKLTDFFLRAGPHAETCWNIFCQMADASRQKNTQAKELLLATILEAVLRTIYNHPFQEGKSGRLFMRRNEMERFRKEFLSDKWIKCCNTALEVHVKLRHRNAHPDWLTSQSGALSKPELKKSYERQICLSRFYGYMILGMAGFKDLEPLFPIVKFSEDN